MDEPERQVLELGCLQIRIAAFCDFLSIQVVSFWTQKRYESLGRFANLEAGFMVKLTWILEFFVIL